MPTHRLLHTAFVATLGGSAPSPGTVDEAKPTDSGPTETQPKDGWSGKIAMVVLGGVLAGVMGLWNRTAEDRRRTKGRVLSSAEASARYLEELADLYEQQVAEACVSETDATSSVWSQLHERAESLHDDAATETRLRKRWAWVLDTINEVSDQQIFASDPTVLRAIADELLKMVGAEREEERPQVIVDMLKATRQSFAERVEERTRESWLEARLDSTATHMRLTEAEAQERLTELLDLWQSTPLETPEKRLSHLHGLAVWVDRHGATALTALLDYTIEMVGFVGDRRAVARAMCPDGRYFPVLPAALLTRLDSWKADATIVELVLKHIVAGKATIATSPNAAETLLTWSSFDRPAAREYVQQTLADTHEAQQLLRNLKQGGQYRIDAVVATASAGCFTETFERLNSDARIGPELTEVWTTFDVSLAQFDSDGYQYLERPSPR